MWMALKLKNPRWSSNAWKVSLLAIDLLKIIDEIHDRIERPGTVVARFGDVLNIHLPLCLTLQKTLRT